VKSVSVMTMPLVVYADNNPRMETLAMLRFGIPPLLESWLLAEDAAELERAAQANFAWLLMAQGRFNDSLAVRAEGKSTEWYFDVA
jgi:hypothetical protein